MCLSFTRTVNVGGNSSSEKFNLNGEYYVLYGVGDGPALPGRLIPHTTGGSPIPTISSHMVNPYKDTGNKTGGSFAKVKGYLVRAHGILMLLAWPFLGSTGIFVAAFMRAALPEGKWFQVHRALMLSSLFVAAAGFVLAFVAQMHSSTPGLIALGSGEVRENIFSIYWYTAKRLCVFFVVVFAIGPEDVTFCNRYYCHISSDCECKQCSPLNPQTLPITDNPLSFHFPF